VRVEESLAQFAARTLDARASNGTQRDGIAEGGVPQVVATRADRVAIVRVEWLDENRIPFGGLTLFDGPGGIGKTTFLAGIIAGVTCGRGFFTGAQIEQQSVLIVGIEDRRSLIAQRLKLYGAELERVHFVDATRIGDRDVPLALPDHIGALERLIIELGVSLVYVDALFSHIVLDGEGRMAQQVRAALHPIGEMCERRNVAFAAMRHWTKSTGSALSRALGSVEFTNYARSVFTFGKHPNDEDLLVCSHTKSNYGRLTGAVAFRLQAHDVLDDNGQPWQVSIAADLGVAEGVTSDDLTMRAPCDPDERGGAAEWLRDYLADGKEHLTADVLKAALKAHAGSRTTLWRAARSIGVVVERTTSFPSVGTWTLPEASEPTRGVEPRSFRSRPVSHIYGTTDDSRQAHRAENVMPQESASRSTVVSRDIDETADETTETAALRGITPLKVSVPNDEAGDFL